MLCPCPRLHADRYLQPYDDRTILAKPFGYPSQKQKSCKANAQANAICSTFAFAQPHPDNDTFSINN
jgi:hypothetical protein